MEDRVPKLDRAIVIGGSMGGLLAARVLAVAVTEDRRRVTGVKGAARVMGDIPCNRARRDQLGGEIIPPTPKGKRGGVMLAHEGDRWTVTLIGHFGQAAPLDLDGFTEYARTLPAPYIYEVVRDSEPVSEPVSARFPASVRHRYESLTRFPEGFLAFGDAISSFNPIYGQGMSVAALEAMELAAALREGTRGLARRFFRRAARVVDMPWTISVGNDLRMPETVGPRNTRINFVNWYMTKLHKAAHSDRLAAMAFFQVANLLAPPASVMRPMVVLAVLRGILPPNGFERPCTKPQARNGRVGW
jgi:hypothetical protein